VGDTTGYVKSVPVRCQPCPACQLRPNQLAWLNNDQARDGRREPWTFLDSGGMKPLPDHRVKSVPRPPPSCLSWAAPVRLGPRITLLHRRRCRNGQRRRFTNLRPTTSDSAGSRPVPLEAGVVVLVPVLVGRTRMQLCHGARPLSSLHPGLRGGVGITEPTYTFIGTRVLPRAQGRKKSPVRSPSRYVGAADRSLYAT